MPTINPPKAPPTRTETVRTAATDRRFLYWLLTFVILTVADISVGVSVGWTVTLMLYFALGSFLTLLLLKLR